jgi:tetratricopeptide (TPR) repeat protein
LITSGDQTDNWTKGFKELIDQFWAEHADRIAIGFDGTDENLLKVFISAGRIVEEFPIMIKDAEMNPDQYLCSRLTACFSALQLGHHYRWGGYSHSCFYKIYKKNTVTLNRPRDFSNELIEIYKSLDSFDKAIAINPDLPEVWHNRGSSLARLNRNTEALASFERALAINPNDAETWNTCGDLLNFFGRYTEAVDSYDKAIAINPEYIEAWCNRGVALAEHRQYSEAVTSFDKALIIKPDAEVVRKNREIALQYGSLRDRNPNI